MAIRQIFHILGCICMGLTLMSASKHLNTSADPHTQDLTINYLDRSLVVNLESPGLTIKKDPEGHLRYLAFQQVTTFYHIYFHPDKRHGKEMVALINQFRMFDNHMLLDGPNYSFGEDGNLLTQGNWKQGQQHGEQQIYNQTGTLIEERLFDQGFPVGSWSRFYADGKISATIQFPDSATIWEETLSVPNRSIKESDSLITMPLRSTRQAIETWYSQGGAKQKEKIYRVYRHRNGFVVEDTGASRSFDRAGRVVHQTDLRQGTGTATSYYQQNGKNYKNHSTWIQGRVISSTQGKAQ